MRLISINPRSESDSVDPCLALDVDIAFPRGLQMPVDVAVEVRTEDKKLLGVARPQLTAGQDRPGLQATDSGRNYDEASSAVPVVLSLSPRQVDYLEGLRSKHRKGDVVLICQVEVRLLVTKTALAHLQPAEDRAGTAAQPVVYRQRTGADPFHSRWTNMWLLSGDNGPTFIERETFRQAATVTVRSSDWVHDYAGAWRGTRYMVVEFPQPDVLRAAPEIEQRLNAAIDAARQSADDIAKGEWNDAVEDLRPVWELLRNHAELSNLLMRDGYTPEAITAFEGIVQQQFSLASKFLHRTDPSGKRINPEIRANKEDAFACYACAMSLLNLVARKATRLQ